MRRVRILEQAAQEATEAAAWYEQARPGLGEEFVRAIEAALEILQHEVVPLARIPGASGRQGAKRLVLRRFPYDIVVRDLRDVRIVVAVAHHSRKPGYWRSRRGT